VVLTHQKIYIYIKFNQSSQIWLKNNKYSAMDGYGVKAWYPEVHPKIEGKWVFIPPKKMIQYDSIGFGPSQIYWSSQPIISGMVKTKMQ